MNFWEDAVMTAKSAAKIVGKKAEEVIDLSKKKLAAAELEGKIDSQYALLGRRCYDSARTGADHTEECRQIIADIDALTEELHALNAQINEMRSKTTCPTCGAENAEDSIFCSQCGQRFDK